MSNEGVEPRLDRGDEEARVGDMVASIGLAGETTSRRRSPDSTINVSATASRSQQEEPSVVLDLGTGTFVGQVEMLKAGMHKVDYSPTIVHSKS